MHIVILFPGSALWTEANCVPMLFQTWPVRQCSADIPLPSSQDVRLCGVYFARMSLLTDGESARGRPGFTQGDMCTWKAPGHPQRHYLTPFRWAADGDRVLFCVWKTGAASIQGESSDFSWVTFLFIIIIMIKKRYFLSKSQWTLSLHTDGEAEPGQCYSYPKL